MFSLFDVKLPNIAYNMIYILYKILYIGYEIILRFNL